MKKVKFHTNVDEYNRGNVWPEDLEIIPRIGETIYVNDNMKEYFRNKHLPIRMKVVDVCYSEETEIYKSEPHVNYLNKYTLVEVELWYKHVDWEFMRLNGLIDQ